MANPAIFRVLADDGIIVSVGDHPKQLLERILLLQGDGRTAEGEGEGGPLRLALLLKAADPKGFARALKANGLSDDEDGQRAYARAAMNLYQVYFVVHSSPFVSSVFGLKYAVFRYSKKG